jgi:hypothetical protein
MEKPGEHPDLWGFFTVIIENRRLRSNLNGSGKTCRLVVDPLDSEEIPERAIDP